MNALIMIVQCSLLLATTLASGEVNIRKRFDAKLPADGVYIIRVYLMRSAARRESPLIPPLQRLFQILRINVFRRIRKRLLRHAVLAA